MDTNFFDFYIQITIEETFDDLLFQLNAAELRSLQTPAIVEFAQELTDREFVNFIEWFDERFPVETWAMPMVMREMFKEIAIEAYLEGLEF